MEIKCYLCGLRKSINEYSKSSRRTAEPTCKRCVAWTETQEPEVIPAPLETGHVSVEEMDGDVWGDQFTTDADFFPGDDLRPRAPITSREALGLEGEGPVDVDQIYDRVDQLQISGTNSTTGTAAPALDVPAHLQAKAEAAMTSTNISSAASEAGASVSTLALPSHLRGKVGDRGTGSISTATTVRKDKEERGRSRAVQYNAYDAKGVAHQRTRIPTVTSGTTTDFSRSASVSTNTTPPCRNVGFAGAQVARAPRPARQLTTPIITTGPKKTDPQVDRQRKMGFCDSDNDSDDDY